MIKVEEMISQQEREEQGKTGEDSMQSERMAKRGEISFLASTLICAHIIDIDVSLSRLSA